MSNSKWGWNPFARKPSKSQPRKDFFDEVPQQNHQVTYHPSYNYAAHQSGQYPASAPPTGYTCEVPPPHASYGSLWRPQQAPYPPSGPAGLAPTTSYGGYPSAMPYTMNPQQNAYNPMPYSAAPGYTHPVPTRTKTRSRSDSTHSQYPSFPNSYHPSHSSNTSSSPSVDPAPYTHRRPSHSRSRSRSRHESRNENSFRGYAGYYQTHADEEPSNRFVPDDYAQQYQPRPKSSLSTHSRASHRSRSRNSNVSIPTTGPPRTSSISPPGPFKLSVVLNARMTQYPSIDWALWDPLTRVKFFIGPGQYGDANQIIRTPTFNGPFPIKEPIRIEAAPGRIDGLYIAITRWGPIEVTPREGQALAIRDVIEGIDDWMKTPLHRTDWNAFDDTLMNQVLAAYERRRKHSKPLHRLPDDPMNGARRVDTLFCQVVWDGLTMAEDFVTTRTLYLRLRGFHDL